MNRISQAIVLATKAHDGQIYGEGPYIFHPLRIMDRVEGGKSEKIVAVLHDVLEDTNVDISKHMYLHMDEIYALHLLTRSPHEPYEDYIDQIAEACEAGHPSGLIAARVKMADLLDNLYHDPPEDKKEKYEKAFNKLLHARAAYLTQRY